MILFDAHVHIYDSFDLDRMIHAALGNFQTAMTSIGAEEDSCTCFLLLAESRDFNYFQILKDTGSPGKQDSGRRWKLEETREKCSVRVCHDDFQGISLFIAAGRQLVTEERLELLALLTEEMFPDHMGFETAVDEIGERGGLAVCPWGAGKWLGTRGRILAEFMRSPAGCRLSLGDSGGRPVIWPASGLFRKLPFKNRLVSGTDPLPLPGEELRVGSFGGYLAGNCSSTRPASDLRDHLSVDNPAVLPFGNSLNPFVFFRNQFLLRRRR